MSMFSLSAGAGEGQKGVGVGWGGGGGVREVFFHILLSLIIVSSFLSSYSFFVLIKMCIIWIYVMSVFCPSVRLAWQKL